VLPAGAELKRVVLAFVVEDCSGFDFQQYAQANKPQYKRWPKDLRATLSIVEQVAFELV